MLGKIFCKSGEFLLAKNNFVITKLNAFIINVMNDSTFKSGRIPIPAWKFTELMNTDKQKAESLKEQWLKKYYIRNTEDRGEHNELIYELNPFLKQEIEKINNRKLNVKWIEGIEALSLDTLDEFHYFDIKEKLQKINQKYRQIVTRDFDELVMNYVMKNAKSVLILSGSLIETLLMYYCEKKKLTTITYQRNNKNISKSIYECDLGDLLIYFEQNKYLGELVPPLGNVSRIHRNYVHPGKELRESETLDDSKISLCFISTIEIIKQIVN